MRNLLRKGVMNLIEACESPAPVYFFVSPGRVLKYLNLVNNDRSIYTFDRELRSCFKMGVFNGNFRPVRNIIDKVNEKIGRERITCRSGNYLLEQIDLQDGRRYIGKISVATKYIYHKKSEERIEEIGLRLEEEILLDYKGIRVMVGPGHSGVVVSGEIGSVGDIERRDWMVIKHEHGNISPELPEAWQMFPNEIFLKK
jgi:hypothetical protein